MIDLAQLQPEDLQGLDAEAAAKVVALLIWRLHGVRRLDCRARSRDQAHGLSSPIWISS